MHGITTERKLRGEDGRRAFRLQAPLRPGKAGGLHGRDAAPNAFYPGGPSEADYLNSAEMGEELYHIVIDNDKVYEYQYDGEVSDDEPELDDDKKSSTAYQRCGY